MYNIVIVLDIMWAEDYKNRFRENSVPPIYTTLEKTVKASIEKVNERKQQN